MAEEESIGAARLDVIANTAQFDVAIDAARTRISAMSSDAQKAYASLNLAEKRRVDSLLKQADTIGFTRQQQVLYNAALKGVPTEILDQLKAKFAAAAGSAKEATDNVRSTSDSLKTLGDTQLLKANQALASYKQQAVDTAAAVKAALVDSATDDARYKGLARAGATYGISMSGGGRTLTEAETAAKQAQIKVLGESAAARDRERKAAKDAAEAQKIAAAAAQAEQQALQKLLGQIDPVNAALSRLDKMESQLRAARARGAISQDDFTAYTASIEQARAKLSGADAAMGHFSLSAAGARRELGVMAGEIARGNIGNLEGSLVTLASRSGLLAAALSPVGLLFTGLAGGAVALAAGFFAGAEETNKLNSALIATGNYAGVTTAQINAMAEALGQSSGDIGRSREALQLLVASGKVSGEQLQTVARPEAIMPLRRGADGRLGVAAAGGGAGGVMVNIDVSIDNSGNATDQTASQGDNAAAARQFASQMASIAKKAISDEMRPGGNLWRAGVKA
ncbi:phage tail length tape measure family protein [Dyella sp.]|uniref:phage tail length tape measure family protein n=1 Tax=Dyella sp. TaxID=1869338 RepID=UPI00283DF3B0|nr:phage tail length tape measure family protein [Dyella sp.]MDR3446010.1 phage tail length tape measure family protein [Dyella sp.]